MRICFPVGQNEGFESRIHGHFGSAPVFLVVDSDSGQVVEIVNRDLQHAHGACSPLKALGGHPVDAVVVAGIGGGALAGLARAGIQVLEAGADTVGENLTLARQGTLHVWSPERSTCGSHGHGNGCGHHTA
jgi:predicted Fe-Mo cluster-binding NifX family protein